MTVLWITLSILLLLTGVGLLTLPSVIDIWRIESGQEPWIK